MAEEVLRVKGLQQLATDFRKLEGPEFLNQLKTANKRIGELVADAARPGIAARSTRAAASLKVSQVANKAQLRFGGKAVPWALGDEFGAFHNALRRSGVRNVHGWNQFPIVKKGGHNIYPAMARMSTQIIKAYSDEIKIIFDRTFSH